VSHFLTFDLEVLLFTANAAKELREGNRPFGVVGVGRGKQNISISRLVLHRSKVTS
jgi:hypothetical protein